VYPLMGFPDPMIVQAAQRLVADHQHNFSHTSRILQQVFIDVITLAKLLLSCKMVIFAFLSAASNHRADPCHKSHLRMERKNIHLLCLRKRVQGSYG
ncbi:hypothetical protein XENOCAPTIV_008142, partial [Xenoophorus captivus]